MAEACNRIVTACMRVTDAGGGLLWLVTPQRQLQRLPERDVLVPSKEGLMGRALSEKTAVIGRDMPVPEGMEHLSGSRGGGDGIISSVRHTYCGHT